MMFPYFAMKKSRISQPGALCLSPKGCVHRSESFGIRMALLGAPLGKNSTFYGTIVWPFHFFMGRIEEFHFFDGRIPVGIFGIFGHCLFSSENSDLWQLLRDFWGNILAWHKWNSEILGVVFGALMGWVLGVNGYGYGYDSEVDNW